MNTANNAAPANEAKPARPKLGLKYGQQAPKPVHGQA